MIEKIIALLQSLLDCFLWFYRKSPNISVKQESKKNCITLIVRNNKDVDIEIKHLLLVKKGYLMSKDYFDECSFFSLYDNPNDELTLTTQNDDLNIGLKVNSKAIELEIPYDKLCSLYEFFIPYKFHEKYEVKYLDKPVKMPKCHIAIHLRSGKIKHIKLPNSFYSYYQNQLNTKYEQDIRILSGKTRVRISFESTEDYEKYKEELLDRDSISCKNSLLLFK